MILKSPHQILIESLYKITEPDEDGPEINKPYIVDVIKKTTSGFIFKDVEHNFTFERTFQHLMTCEIEKL